MSGNNNSGVFSIAIQPKPVRDNDDDNARLCNKWLNNGLSRNKAIQFLLGQLEELGCKPPEGFIQCRKCEKPQASGFGKVIEYVKKENEDPCGEVIADFQGAIQLSDKQGGKRLQIQPEIFICEQYMENETMTHKTLVHELIHAIDYCRTKMDPVNNCLHLACTEVRAENLSGECGIVRELPRMKSLLGHGAECVKRRAALSVRANPKCAPRADEYVEAAMPRCFQDNFPFERHPNQL